MSDTYTPAKSHTQIELLKIPPHSIEAEQSVLGGLMLDAEAWDKMNDTLSAGDFYRTDHRLIFQAISSLVSASKPVDVITVIETLKNLNQLHSAGGEAYLFELAKNTPSAANIAAYASIVRERSVLRQLISISNAIADSAFNPQGREANELLDEAERKVFEIAEKGSNQAGPETIKNLLTKAVEKIDFLYHAESPITGLPTGFTDLDAMTSGLQPSDLIIIAGRPSMGKTILGVNIAEYAAIKSKKPILIFSLEMPGDSIAMRLLSSLGRVDHHNLRTGKLGDADWASITSAVSLLSEAKIFIDDTPGLSPAEMRSRARRLVREQGELGLIVVDYLQLMHIPGFKENRTGEISEISRSLKLLARELNVPLIALSQLNRGLEQRADKRPMMADLRDCVTGETLVCLTNGKRVPIASLVDETPEVWAIDKNEKLIAAKTDKIWKVGEKEIFEVKLASGRSIKTSAKHQFYTAKGWQQLKDIQLHDRIAICRKLPEPEQTHNEKNDGDLFWDSIVAINAAGVADVYDITVPGAASWLADGIISHNSGAIEQDADVIAFIYRDEVYHEDTPDKGIAEIIIGKQRNGPIGKVKLTFLGKYTRFENHMAKRYGYEG